MTPTNKPQKLNPADYMILYIRINKIRDELNRSTSLMERKFLFEHVQNRFAPADHIWSADKNVIAHSYADLQEDQYYVIFAHRVPEIVDKKKNGKTFGRWVWRFSLNMPEKLIRKAYEFYKANPSDANLCLRYADQLMHPKIADDIAEFEFVDPQITQ